MTYASPEIIFVSEYSSIVEFECAIGAAKHTDIYAARFRVRGGIPIAMAAWRARSVMRCAIPGTLNPRRQLIVFVQTGHRRLTTRGNFRNYQYRRLLPKEQIHPLIAWRVHPEVIMFASQLPDCGRIEAIVRKEKTA